ncbi:unnamed protein product [Thlaspi arvense]|uniref:Uncharacterized protein n=1 Tax=Thlaspi arvense TaxID=13288 RepID=A0AAU9SQ95_THLAR|nr:unnamed protein product [Thlaspi arvense]
MEIARLLMQNPWFSHGHASDLNPLPLTAGDSLLPPPLVPLDPPDPLASFPLSQFPPLSSPLSQKTSSFPRTTPLKAPVGKTGDKICSNTETTDVEMTQLHTTSPEAAEPSFPKTRSENVTVPENFTVLKPRSTSPLQTNKALNTASSIPTAATKAQVPQPVQQSRAQQPTVPVENQTANGPTLAERTRTFEDRSLRRLAPITFSDTGRPRVIIPDEVFQRGEELHRDFIVYYFNGRPPPYCQI